MRPLSAFEFAYWLQGAIEIEGLSSLTSEQAQKVVEVAKQVEGNDPFVFFTKLMLSMQGPAGFDAINRELQKKFIHDIDPSYEGDQEHFHAIHRGEVSE